MKSISFSQIIDIILLILLLVFIGQNLESTKVKLLMFGFDMPIIVLVAIVFCIGFFTAKVFKK